MTSVVKHVDFAMTGVSALAKVCATIDMECPFTYALIVMDFDMPNMNGAQCAKMINMLYDTVKPALGQVFIRPNIICLTSNDSKETHR